MYMYKCVLVWSRSCLVLSRFVLSRPVPSCLVLCDSCRMFRVSLLSVSCVRRCVCCLSFVLSVASWLWVSRLSCSRVPVFVGCFGCLSLCCALLWCVAMCVFCVRGVRCAVCVVWHAEKPAVCSKRPRVNQHHARHVVTTCGRGAGTHGDVLRVTRTRTRNTHPRTRTHTDTRTYSVVRMWPNCSVLRSHKTLMAADRIEDCHNTLSGQFDCFQCMVTI